MVLILVRGALVILLFAGLLSAAGAAVPEAAVAQDRIADTDGDGLDDSKDNCPHLAAGAAGSTYLGCPSEDPDADGFPSISMPPVGLPGDFCGEIAGTSEFIGCPSTDPDGDAVDGDACGQTPAPPPTGCPMVAPPDVEDVQARKMALDRRSGVSLYGQPFRPRPAGLFSPRTLTLWLPKGLSTSLLTGSVKSCTKAQAQSLGPRSRRCTVSAAGRLNGDDGREAWRAYAGPRQGKKRHIWLRARNEDGSLIGFDTGVAQKVSGPYSTKLVLGLSRLELTVRGFEAQILGLRETGKCPSKGWRLRLQVETEHGTDTASWREPCEGGRND
jgi:hypothetical protein